MKASSTKAARPVLTGDINTTLWEALRDCRRKLAEEQQVPPYVIFHNSTLEDLCRLLPRNLAEFGTVSGVGARKQEKYGPVFLEIINRHREQITPASLIQ